MNILSYLKSFLDKQSDKNKTTAVSEKSSNANDKLEELRGFLQSKQSEEIQKDYSVETPSYQRYEYEAPSDESIKSSAEAELGDYFNKGETSIKDEYAAKEKNLNASRADSERLFDDSSEKLKTAYKQTAQAMSDDSLKRGLARSSIALNEQAAVSNAYLDDLDKLIAQRDQRISDIDSELNELDSQLQSALDSFKISYAAKLTQRMNELKEEREKNKREAIKYNNSLLKQEYDERVAKEEREKKQSSDSLNDQDRASNSQKEALMREFYEKAVEALESLSADEARELLQDPIFRDNLNDYYYYTLYYRYR